MEITTEFYVKNENKINIENMGKIKIQTTIGAPLDKVWKAWTTPEHITKWNFASEDWHCPRVENDMQVGGKYKARMEAKDGSFGFDFEATYDEIVDRKKIVYTIADGRKVDTQFREISGQTSISTEFDPENQNPMEMQQQGWQAILDNFKKYVENLD